MLSVCLSLFTLSYVWTNWLQCGIVARQSDNAMSACCNVILEDRAEDGHSVFGN